MSGLATGTILGALSQLVDALTGLERTLSTPVPWAVSHLCLRHEAPLITPTVSNTFVDRYAYLALCFGRSSLKNGCQSD
jgi:hypothetical protein